MGAFVFRFSFAIPLPWGQQDHYDHFCKSLCHETWKHSRWKNHLKVWIFPGSSLEDIWSQLLKNLLPRIEKEVELMPIIMDWISSLTCWWPKASISDADLPHGSFNEDATLASSHAILGIARPQWLNSLKRSFWVRRWWLLQTSTREESTQVLDYIG